jgi:hypothetical protein
MSTATIRITVLLMFAAVVSVTAGPAGAQQEPSPGSDVPAAELVGESPPAVADIPTPRNARKPKNDEDLKFWIRNMMVYHNFTVEEVREATGLTADEVAEAVKRFDARPQSRTRRPPGSTLLVLPYPGGRHPRTGFLEGAIDPQRETKFSVFTPWDANSYVVVDAPEAIWSNLGLTYLAHTHMDTIWTKQSVELPRLEWKRGPGLQLSVARRLPNGLEFGMQVVPKKTVVLMEMWLKNGTKEKLSKLVVQNCVMTKMAAGFEQQTNRNKVISNPYVTCRNEAGDRWIITAWTYCVRPWANPQCPCFHSDPQFPDLAPGQTHKLRGWLSFYEGKDIAGEMRRIDATDWRNIDLSAEPTARIPTYEKRRQETPR